MAGPQLQLMPGEKMILHEHPHWWFFWKQVAAGIGVLALVALWVMWDGTLGTIAGWLVVLAFVVWLLNTIYQFAQWQTTRFAVTDQRVAYQSGFTRRRGVSIPLNRVNNVNFDQNLMARILNNGTVTIESAGESGDSVFENIPNPEHVRNTIFAQVEADEVADSKRNAQNMRDAMQGLPSDAPGGGGSTAERLQQLNELREKGLVTLEEFEAKRKEIVGGL
ncbi:MAG: PH domain-containing protein [Ilumatobacteraceae bacterium]